MTIDKKLIHFKTKDIFDQKKDQIKDTSIVFVKDANMIYTHGEEYQFVGWSVLERKTVITFSIVHQSYQAEEGMTWEEWVNSQYVDDRIYIKNGIVWWNDSQVYISSAVKPVFVNGSDIIIPNNNYSLYGGSGGN